MRSIALYIHQNNLQKNGEEKQCSSENDSGENKPKEEEVSEELHLNIWKVQQGSFILKPKLYIDFGIMTTFHTDVMYLYLPFQIKGKPTDLGKKLQDNREMLCTVFNENLLSETCKNNCYSSVKNPNDSGSAGFYLFRLGNGNIEIEHLEEDVERGTFIKITRNGWYDNQEQTDSEDLKKKVYVRLRIEVEDIKVIVRSEFVSNDLLQAAFSKVDLYDIRINETREIHPKVCEKMNTENFELCKFKKVHLFYIADSREKVENESSLKSDSRILEDGKWIQYEPRNDLRRSIFLAHHWKKRQKEDKPIIDNFSLFFSTIYPHIHWLHLMAFLSVIILLGWIGDMLGFNFSEVSEDWKTWIRPIIIGIVALFVLIYVIVLNFGYQFRIFRKR